MTIAYGHTQARRGQQGVPCGTILQVPCWKNVCISFGSGEADFSFFVAVLCEEGMTSCVMFPLPVSGFARFVRPSGIGDVCSSPYLSLALCISVACRVRRKPRTSAQVPQSIFKVRTCFICFVILRPQFSCDLGSVPTCEFSSRLKRSYA